MAITGQLKVNHDAFQADLSDLLATNPDEYAVYTDGERRALFKSQSEAYDFAYTEYGLDTEFFIGKIERVNPQPVSFAWEYGVMFAG